MIFCPALQLQMITSAMQKNSCKNAKITKKSIAEGFYVNHQDFCDCPISQR